MRYELEPGKAESQRPTATTTAFTVPAPQGRLGVFSTYVGLGVDHILRGIDHLMFVFALILLVRDLRQLIGAVTAFTVAHSLSLAAATLGWIVVPAAPVEAVIALSIMFLAAELVSAGGNVPRENLSMISSAASTPSSPPARTMSYQRRPVSSATISGEPAKRAGKKPMLSE